MPLHTRCTQQQNQGIFLQEGMGEEQSPTQASWESSSYTAFTFL